MSLAGFWAAVRWQTVGNAAGQLIGVLGLPLLSRAFTDEDFAAQALFQQFTMFFAGIMTLRYEYLVPLPKHEHETKALIRLVWFLSIAGVLLLSPLLPLVLHLFPQWQSGNSTHWLWLTPLTAALVSLSLAYQHRVQRHGGYRRSGMGEIIAKLGYVGTGLAGAAMQLGTIALLMTTAIAAGCKLLLHASARPPVPSGVDMPETEHLPIREAASRYGALARSMVGSHLLGTVTGMAPVLAIGAMHGASALGQFGLAMGTIFLPAGLIGSAIGQVYYQRAAAMWARGDTIAPLWQQIAKRLIVMGAPLHLLVGLLSAWLYPLIFGAQWSLAGQTAAWLTLAAFFSFISAPMDRTSLIVGEWRYLIGWHLLRAVTTLIVLGLSWWQQWAYLQTVQALVLQMSAMYAVDLWAEFRFAQRLPADYSTSRQATT